MISLMLICQEWTTTNKFNKIEENKDENMNMIKTTQNIFKIRRLIVTRILARNKWMGYYNRLKETQISIRINIKRTMKIQKKKITLRI